MSVLLLPLDAIFVDQSLNVSRGGNSIQESNVVSLAKDIEENGQLEPLGVVSLEDALWLSEPKKAEIASKHEFVLVFGFRRFAALKLLSKTLKVEAKAIEQGPLTLAAAELANVAENWSREPPTEFDLTMACARFVKTHKIEVPVVARRVNKTEGFVESCVKIATKVAPDLLEHYKVNCSKETRRRMVELSAIEAPSKQEVYEAQRERWKELEEQAQRSIRNDPQGGMRRKPGRKKSSSSIATRMDLREASESVMLAREFFDGESWYPINGSMKRLLREWIRWSMNTSIELPVR